MTVNLPAYTEEHLCQRLWITTRGRWYSSVTEVLYSFDQTLYAWFFLITDLSKMRAGHRTVKLFCTRLYNVRKFWNFVQHKLNTCCHVYKEYSCRANLLSRSFWRLPWKGKVGLFSLGSSNGEECSMEDENKRDRNKHFYLRPMV